MMKDMTYLKESNEANEGCLLRKQHKLPFSTNKAWRAKDLLELVHIDICGPMSTSSINNNMYFILFIDDFSRMTWVYFLKEKSEVFGIFKSNCDKEYNSHKLGKFCKDEGIERQLTVAYSLQRNGVSKRKNYTIMEMAISMLKEKGFQITFGVEAVYIVVYILNKCPTKTKRHKLEDKTVCGIFLGYNTQSKGYQVHNLQTKKLKISRDVEIDENEEEKVVKNNMLVPMQQPQEEAEEVVGDPSMLSPSP
ncbi:hypothetical protein CR513_22649, partial [Mucuna pruriens]